MDMRQRVADAIAEAFRAAFSQDAPEGLSGMLEVPPDPAMGDYAFPCFKLSRALRMAPPAIADKLREAFAARDLADVECAGGYLNIRFARGAFARDVVEAVIASGGRWGASDEGAGKTVCIDYSSVNIAKRFHIGHLSTTMIGHSLKRIYELLGWKAIGINHLGDWGTQFGKMLCAYKRYGSREAVEKGGVDELTRLYVHFHEEAEKDPSLEDEGRAWFKKIETGDPEALEIFEWFKELTLKDVSRIYDVLNVTFDYYTGESFYQDKMERVTSELDARGLLTHSEGAEIVSLEAFKMPPCLIRKRDGTTLYATRDIAAALYRKDTFHFDKCLYVVAYQQDLHFRQWFKVVELMGYPWAKDELIHVAFGMISYEGQALATRKGHVVYLEDLLTRATQKARDIIREKNPGLENADEIARQVGVGAVVFADLFNSRIKDIDFWWDRVLNFDGETGPYVQYTHARCCSVLRKAAEAGASENDPDYEALADEEAQAVLRLLSRFPAAVSEAALRNEPSIVTRAVTEIAKAYNKFYYERRILDENARHAAARIRLTRAARDTIKTGLYLIGVDAPEKM